MRRKIKKIDPNELFDADDINGTTIKAEMRKLYPAIHQKLSERGWSARDMVNWLEERGVSMSIETFRVYLYRLDKEVGYVRSNKGFDVAGKRTPSTATSPQLPRLAGGKNTNSADELVRPPGITDARWSEMKAQARANNRKQNKPK